MLLEATRVAATLVLELRIEDDRFGVFERIYRLVSVLALLAWLWQITDMVAMVWVELETIWVELGRAFVGILVPEPYFSG